MSCNNFVCPFHEIQASDYLSSDSDMKCLITDTVKQVRFNKGEILFAQGQPSDSLFSLSSGIVKITYHSQDGREQIIGLSTPGKLLVGLQSINNDYYEYSAVAETETYACKIRHRALLRTAQKTRRSRHAARRRTQRTTRPQPLTHDGHGAQMRRLEDRVLHQADRPELGTWE